MKNNDESYNQFLDDLRRNSGTPSDKTDRPDNHSSGRLEQVLTGKTHSQSLDERVNSSEVSLRRTREKLSEHFAWVAAVALLIVVLEIIATALWVGAYFWADSLDVQAVAKIIADDGAHSILYAWAISISLPSVIVSVVIIIVCYIVYRHYKDLSISI